MDDNLKAFLVILWLGSTFLLFVWGYGIGHKNGQIDAINGKIYFALKHQADGSSSWEKIENKENSK